MGAINAMIPYQETFGLSGAGSSSGIVFIIYSLGQIAAFPFCGMLADGFGRRWCIFVGCLVVLIGTAVQASANGLGQFMGGRFVLGFGAAIASAAAPAYVVELAHPAYRGFMAGMCKCFLINLGTLLTRIGRILEPNHLCIFSGHRCSVLFADAISKTTTSGGWEIFSLDGLHTARTCESGDRKEFGSLISANRIPGTSQHRGPGECRPLFKLGYQV